MTRKQLAAMFGVFSPAFVVLHVCCPRGNIFIILGVSAFFAFMIVKSIVYTMDVRKAKKAGVDAMGPAIKEAENAGKNYEDVHNPGFARMACNTFHGNPVFDSTAPFWSEDENSHSNPVWPEDEK